ncbi:esterase [Corynebacterium suranareeae]|uniref:Esterase n=1 Tax=Corynebacterium suranareeae TaxID=2506452 RepID=A0A169S547_9CORY|nr:alpha/beta hydrolase-fold protein [Corynebacterium suranareeae]BAU97156.1 esterase [Corynebacterium suranareeae]
MSTLPKQATEHVKRLIRSDWDALDLAEIEKSPLISDDAGAETVALTVARKARTTDERLIFNLDTLTHVSRLDLEPFLLEKITWRGEAWHVGSFLLPRELRCGAGFLPMQGWDPSIGQDRATWKKKMSESIPLQPLKETSFGLSVLALPGATPSPHTDEVDPTYLLQGSVEEISFTSTTFDIPMKVAVYTPPRPAEDIAFISDGQICLNDVSLLPALESAQTDGTIPPTTCVFFAPAAAKDRSRVLGDPDKLAGFLRTEVLEILRDRSIAHTAESTTIVGASLGGFAAANIVLDAPDLVKNAIVQSAALWWPDREFETLAKYRETQDFDLGITIFHEVGSLEPYLLHENREFAQILQERQITHLSREYCGGHDYVCWRAGIIDGLAWIAANRSPA